MVNPILLRCCRKCNEELPLSSFPLSRKNNTRHAWRCKACFRAAQKAKYDRAFRRDARLKSEYGISQAIYKEMLANQQGRCAICSTDKPRGPWNVFCVDHCHVTGKIRGILCYACNTTLGAVGDDLKGLQRFVDYLTLGNFKNKIAKRTQPRLKSVLRYVDAKGCRCAKDAPGARSVLMKTESYYAKISGRWVPLRTTDPVRAQAILDGWRSPSGQPPEQPETPLPGFFSAF